MQKHSPSVGGNVGLRRGGPEVLIDICYEKAVVYKSIPTRTFCAYKIEAHIAYSVVIGIQKFYLGGKTPGGDTAEI